MFGLSDSKLEQSNSMRSLIARYLILAFVLWKVCKIFICFTNYPVCEKHIIVLISVFEAAVANASKERSHPTFSSLEFLSSSQN